MKGGGGDWKVAHGSGGDSGRRFKKKRKGATMVKLKDELDWEGWGTGWQGKTW